MVSKIRFFAGNDNIDKNEELHQERHAVECALYYFRVWYIHRRNYKIS